MTAAAPVPREQRGSSVHYLVKCMATAAVLIGGSAGLAAGASAALDTGGSAADVVATLRTQDYAVQINGSPGVPLSECTVTDIHGLSGSDIDATGQRIDPTTFSTVYVDTTCPSDG
ncbi:MAG: hypothetical protein HYZ38_12495 [Mycobacterium sp.]|nr:hypothetical protein [Mycobacterium sp.]